MHALVFSEGRGCRISLVLPARACRVSPHPKGRNYVAQSLVFSEGRDWRVPLALGAAFGVLPARACPAATHNRKKKGQTFRSHSSSPKAVIGGCRLHWAQRWGISRQGVFSCHPQPKKKKRAEFPPALKGAMRWCVFSQGRDWRVSLALGAALGYYPLGRAQLPENRRKKKALKAAQTWCSHSSSQKAVTRGLTCCYPLTLSWTDVGQSLVFLEGCHTRSQLPALPPRPPRWEELSPALEDT